MSDVQIVDTSKKLDYKIVERQNKFLHSFNWAGERDRPFRKNYQRSSLHNERWKGEIKILKNSKSLLRKRSQNVR